LEGGEEIKTEEKIIELTNKFMKPTQSLCLSLLLQITTHIKYIKAEEGKMEKNPRPLGSLQQTP
jgi:hypothetical protein